MLLVALLQVAQPGDSASLVHANGRVPRAVTAVFAERAPAIDGKLNDPAWQLAAPERGFRRDSPSDGNPATNDVEVRVVYDRDALYVGARMFDDRPDLISRRLNRRDSFGDFNDVFFALIDSYHDHRTQFVFGVTPAGERRDGSASDDTNLTLDAGWDPVWEAKTSIDSLGWTAEFRIPFSQLRFPPSDRHVWGVQFRRDNRRAGEAADWQWSPRTEPGQVSKYGHLIGLANIPAPKRLEILPYSSSQARLTEGLVAGHPFDDGSETSFGGGVDLKYGVTSDLTLNATINPDFGQVEADPSVVNLTAFETFFEERRPFFVEGSNIFGFNANFGQDRFFYTRRIGRAFFQSALGSAAFVDEPSATSILGAAKLSGRTRSGWSIGVLDAVTAREHARVADLPTGTVREVPVEPRSNYGVLRVKRDLSQGQSGYGFMATTVNRAATATDFPFVNRSAYLGATDFYHRWGQNAYQIDGYLAASSIAGPPEAMVLAQTSSARYYQRPDQSYSRFDPTRTSLRGWASQFQFSKTQGNLVAQLVANVTSPGFEVNDAGFQQEADRIRLAALVTRRWVSPGRLGRGGSLSVNPTQILNFGGDRLATQLNLAASLETHSFWSINLDFSLRPSSLDDRETRGGPLLEKPAGAAAFLHLGTDGRRRLSAFVGGGYQGLGEAGRQFNTFVRIAVRDGGRFTFSTTPSYQNNRATRFYLGAYADPTATATFQSRYLFAPLQQHVFSLATRLDYYFTPSLSLQLYAEPFVATGDYDNPFSFAAPRTFRFLRYGDGSSTLSIDPTTKAVTADADGDGPAPSFSYPNPDFRVRALRSNLVLRWEYRPGSTLFLVWNQNRFGAGADPRFRLFDHLGGIFDEPMQNVLLLKANYYFSF
ncbi:MAG: carbohydrate binding family 9 domain-containing protein [Gemmatimonadetes bacterium]|nr:carbohydrate binding family 9 domain-containing protein [Gemmatimonadota bacterium]